jgi:hypothetical protein
MIDTVQVEQRVLLLPVLVVRAVLHEVVPCDHVTLEVHLIDVGG